MDDREELTYNFTFKDIYSTCVYEDCKSETEHHLTMAMNLFIRALINKGREREETIEKLTFELERLKQ